MAKSKPQGQAAPPLPSLGQVPNKDLALRLHYMHQTATFLHLAQASASSSAPSFSTTAEANVPEQKGRGSRRTRRRKGERGREDGEEGSLTRLARGIAHGIKGIAVHNKAKLDPVFKRSICQACSTVLIPGATSRVSVRPSRSHSHLVREMCLTCSHQRSIPAPPSGSLPAFSPSSVSLALPSSESAPSDPAPTPPPPSETLPPTESSGRDRTQPRKRGVRREVELAERRGVGHVRFDGGEMSMV